MSDKLLWRIYVTVVLLCGAGMLWCSFKIYQAGIPPTPAEIEAMWEAKYGNKHK